MKKILPILIGVGVVIVAAAAFLIFKGGKNNSSTVTEETSVPTLSEAEWPAISLTPTDNPGVPGSLGHWLDFKVEKINIAKAVSMDYLLVYSTSDGGQQGVPGTVKLTGTNIEKRMLLGSESSGKFRYDAGVETGTMTITFRDSNGKSVGKLSTEFHLQSGVTELTSADGVFKYTLDKAAKGVYFVTMKTYLEPTVAAVSWQGGYGVFASDGKPHTGTIVK